MKHQEASGNIKIRYSNSTAEFLASDVNGKDVVSKFSSDKQFVLRCVEQAKADGFEASIITGKVKLPRRTVKVYTVAFEEEK